MVTMTMAADREQVSKFAPEESDDEWDDLWLVKYEDGDAEHLDLDEVKQRVVRLAEVSPQLTCSNLLSFHARFLQNLALPPSQPPPSYLRSSVVACLSAQYRAGCVYLCVFYPSPCHKPPSIISISTGAFVADAAARSRYVV